MDDYDINSEEHMESVELVREHLVNTLLAEVAILVKGISSFPREDQQRLAVASLLDALLQMGTGLPELTIIAGARLDLTVSEAVTQSAMRRPCALN
jgi:hypothetical protein